MSNGVTMKSIAAQAGVTQATVSMSLANNPRIPAVTRERIQAIARKLNYQPNPHVSTLMRIRRQGKPLKDKPALALVCAQRTSNGWRDHPAPTIRPMREGPSSAGDPANAGRSIRARDAARLPAAGVLAASGRHVERALL